MSSTYTYYPAPGCSNTTATSRDKVGQPRNTTTQDFQHLSPFSPQVGSSSSSPGFSIHTPPDSVFTDFTDADDPFFGVDFNAPGVATPSFLQDDVQPIDGSGALADGSGVLAAPAESQHVNHAASYLPLSPDKTPSLPGGSPNSQLKEEAASRGVFPDLVQTSVAPQNLSLTHESTAASESKQHGGPQLTPRTNDSANPSEDGVAPAATMQSPLVTVSHWDRDHNSSISESRDAEAAQTRGSPTFSTARDGTGRWIPDHVTGQSGLPPTARSDAQVESINDLAAQRDMEQRKQEIDEWLQRSTHSSDNTPPDPPDVEDDGIPQKEIPLGDMTENKPIPGQTYFRETGGGPLTREDLEIMRQGRPWEDAPIPFSISQSNSTPYQPETSNAAILKYQRMCQDNDSIVSRAATWGTRRLSLPSLIDTEVQITGNLFKKLSIGRGEARRPSILGNIRSLVRRPSNSGNKRSRAEHEDASSSVTESSTEKKDTQAKLAPPSPKPGWAKKQSVPSINTAFVDVGSRIASIGTTHARTSSVSATPITSPKSPSGLSLSVKRPLRFRSKSETSGIVDLWKRSGGPPVPNTKVHAAPEADEDEEDEDDLYEEGDVKNDSGNLIDEITPTIAGFQQHVVRLNPMLNTPGHYLVDRIAHQQMIRYKNLLNLRVKHLQAVAAGNCQCGSTCVDSGGSANILDSKGEQRGLDPPSSRFDGSDGDITPVEGLINQDSFPQGIPMPRTTSLPAEFECQLCFTAKKFQKPSDWTKHVHEDVQPFTCTWERCREPKMFKRKADWVRHENEGHRHLEWWTCDVDDCRHKCYRRDNFLQHLVREHRFAEPKIKTKAAMKRAAGGIDPTWAKVEQCHHETDALPQSEPCRFCGKTFPSWKKLTVHLAKHMEQISLPILKLVAKKELDEHTIISPVQDPPPRQFPHDFSDKQDQHRAFGPSLTIPQSGPMAYPHHGPPLGMYPLAPPTQGYHAAGLYSPNFDSLSHGIAQTQISMPPMAHHQPHQQHQGFQSLNSQAAFPELPTTSAGAYMSTPPQASPNYMTMAPDLEPFPTLSMDALGLGLQNPTGVAEQLPYGNGGLAVEQQQQQFTPQGSVSPYGPSPNMPQGGFF
ncbi:hypothetical protein MYCTH_105777 [Thermothelomyces thermophilus ATCC 42464]|uniref:C2H2-type domain-containing protein n=1 Tax=Thermothelomyces thermophilus (strain ATCC 42464 / BCRC 31852 / DSM 1799) TaxID=573729 RepID=G2Q342_THET4|nr:uncharacterized protein MYCTH_105777 [Thermothelomyces thermophilus ATCC 42464]AEO53505.1 hypothetical protein MYCTH_105777 [Thermothelomyces thermophilus ATCC 42464]